LIIFWRCIGGTWNPPILQVEWMGWYYLIAKVDC
jgi:hypothetical protein